MTEPSPTSRRPRLTRGAWVIAIYTFIMSIAALRNRYQIPGWDEPRAYPLALGVIGVAGAILLLMRMSQARIMYIAWALLLLVPVLLAIEPPVWSSVVVFLCMLVLSVIMIREVRRNTGPVGTGN